MNLGRSRPSGSGKHLQLRRKPRCIPSAWKRTWPGAFWILPVALGHAACNDPRQAGELPFVTRDSAGVVVVENRRPGWGNKEGWRGEVDPMLVLQSRPADVVPCYRVGGAVRVSDGRFVVADGGNQELRLYDASGSFLRRFAGPGNGPGEFRGVGRLWKLGGDSVVVADWRGWSFTLATFGPDGRFVRSWQMSAPREVAIAPPPWTWARPVASSA